MSKHCAHPPSISSRPSSMVTPRPISRACTIFSPPSRSNNKEWRRNLLIERRCLAPIPRAASQRGLDSDEASHVNIQRLRRLTLQLRLFTL